MPVLLRAGVVVVEGIEPSWPLSDDAFTARPVSIAGLYHRWSGRRESNPHGFPQRSQRCASAIPPRPDGAPARIRTGTTQGQQGLSLPRLPFRHERVVRRAGVEPARAEAQPCLRRLRLPVPPAAHVVFDCGGGDRFRTCNPVRGRRFSGPLDVPDLSTPPQAGRLRALIAQA